LVLIINIFKIYVSERLNFYFLKFLSKIKFFLKKKHVKTGRKKKQLEIDCINIAIENKGDSQAIRKPRFCITLQFSLLLLLSSFLAFFSNYTSFVKRILNN
jgi:hypothetical protein